MAIPACSSVYVPRISLNIQPVPTCMENSPKFEGHQGRIRECMGGCLLNDDVFCAIMGGIRNNCEDHMF